jgi:hypothetical protein
MKRSEIRDRELLAIAKNVLRLDTLETRNGDDLDFLGNVAVWDVKAALEAAYEAGRKAPRS